MILAYRAGIKNIYKINPEKPMSWELAAKKSPSASRMNLFQLESGNIYI